MSLCQTGTKTLFGAIPIVLCILLFSGCQAPKTNEADYVVTVFPLKMILDPLVKGRKTVDCLLPPGASPHTYTLSPSRATQLASADIVFYVDDALDGWAARMASGSKVGLLSLVPEDQRLAFEMGHDDASHAEGHEEGETNPHFWSDPHVVASMVPALVAILSEQDPEGSDLYASNGASFLAELQALDRDVTEQLSGLPPASLVAFHPSWSYYFKRYDIPVAAYVEPIPGKELSPRKILELRAALNKGPHIVVLTEVQLPRKSAEALAEALAATMAEIDPLGGRPPLTSYDALLRHNTTQLVAALQ